VLPYWHLFTHVEHTPLLAHISRYGGDEGGFTLGFSFQPMVLHYYMICWREALPFIVLIFLVDHTCEELLHTSLGQI
jgi:hypothetical protein